MRNKRVIQIKNDRLILIRNNLRLVIWLAFNHKIEDLIDNQSKLLHTDLDDKNKNIKIRCLGDKISEISDIFEKSICYCSKCYSKTKDMGYNSVKSSWFCIDCLEQSFYMPSQKKDVPLSKLQIKEFFDRLNGLEGCRFDGVNWRCNSDHKYSRKILLKMGINLPDQQKFLNFCDFYGGHCDCEILLNVPQILIKER